MPNSLQFDAVLREWAEVFMRRSMRDFLKFTKGAGLSMPQFSTLSRLYYRGACPISDIGDDLGVTPAAASQMIDRLAQQGLIERAEDAHDRRVKQIALTRKGRALIEKGIEARRRWMAELAGVLTAEEQAAIITALTALTEAARQREAA